MVLRVQQMRVRVPATRRTNSCVAVAMPDRWPSRLSAERSAGENRAGRTRDRHQRGAAHVRSVADMAGDLDARAAASRTVSADQRQAGDDARPCGRPPWRAAAVSVRDGGNRGHVAGAAEVLGERARHRSVDLQRRNEGVGAEQGVIVLATSSQAPNAIHVCDSRLEDLRIPQSRGVPCAKRRCHVQVLFEYQARRDRKSSGSHDDFIALDLPHCGASAGARPR